MKISIVIPTYNHLLDLKYFLVSLFKQKYDNWEAIIVNDGSTDGTREYLEKFIDDRIKVVDFLENRGQAVAANEGLKHITGDLVFPLFDDEDRFLFDIFSNLSNEDSEYDFFYGDYYINTNGNFTFARVPEFDDVKKRLKTVQCIGSGAVCYKRYVIEEVGGFDPEVTGNLDWDYPLRVIYKHGFKGKKTDYPFYIVNVKNKPEKQKINRYSLDIIRRRIHEGYY